MQTTFREVGTVYYIIHVISSKTKKNIVFYMKTSTLCKLHPIQYYYTNGIKRAVT